MFADGSQCKHVADKLAISEGTAKLHLHHIYSKLNLRLRVELVTVYAAARPRLTAPAPSCRGTLRSPDFRLPQSHKRATPRNGKVA